MTTNEHRKGKPRAYRDVEMRSHAEARVASFFDYHDIDWLYEPARIGPLEYLPDFYLPEENVYVEVKPPGISVSELAKFYYTAEVMEPKSDFVLFYVDKTWRYLVWDWFFKYKNLAGEERWLWASSEDWVGNCIPKEGFPGCMYANIASNEANQLGTWARLRLHA